jgi:hypothetical protein
MTEQAYTYFVPANVVTELELKLEMVETKLKIADLELHRQKALHTIDRCQIIEQFTKPNYN